MLAVEVAKQDDLRARRQGMLERASVPSAATKHNKAQTVVIQTFLVRVAKNKKKAENIFRQFARESPVVKWISTLCDKKKAACLQQHKKSARHWARTDKKPNMNQRDVHAQNESTHIYYYIVV